MNLSASPHEHRIRGVGRGRGDRVGQRQTGWVGPRARDHRADGDRPAGRGIRDARAEADRRCGATCSASSQVKKRAHGDGVGGAGVRAYVEVLGRRYRRPPLHFRASARNNVSRWPCSMPGCSGCRFSRQTFSGSATRWPCDSRSPDRRSVARRSAQTISAPAGRCRSAGISGRPSHRRAAARSPRLLRRAAFHRGGSCRRPRSR
jgi:hypothetical protein